MASSGLFPGRYDRWRKDLKLDLSSVITELGMSMGCWVYPMLGEGPMPMGIGGDGGWEDPGGMCPMPSPPPFMMHPLPSPPPFHLGPPPLPLPLPPPPPAAGGIGPPFFQYPAHNVNRVQQMRLGPPVGGSPVNSNSSNHHHHHHLPNNKNKLEVNNDYCQHFLDTGQRPHNFIRDVMVEEGVADHPKLSRLLELKKGLVSRRATPPMGLRVDLKNFDLRRLSNKFDVIVVDPPWEEYARRAAPHHHVVPPVWTNQEIESLNIEDIGKYLGSYGIHKLPYEYCPNVVDWLFGGSSW